MYIIFDSNIWISELGLNSAKGAATRFFVKKKGATVIVPEVIKLETERKLRNELGNYIAEISKNYQQLLTIFGKLKEIVLPGETEIHEKVSTIFERSHLDIVEIPLSLESARSSFLKTIDKLAPSDKDQQFKDGVIWADCIRLLEKEDVYLVTSDKAFYQNRQYGEGLAKSLAGEAAKYPGEIRLFSTVSELLQEIKTEVELDNIKLVDKFVESNRTSIDGILSRNSFSLVEEPLVSTDIYATEDPNKLYVEFKIVYECEDVASGTRSDARLTLKGDCSYLLNENEFSAIRNYGEELVFKTPEGEDKSVRNVTLFAEGIVLGHKTVEHSVRYRLVDES